MTDKSFSASGIGARLKLIEFHAALTTFLAASAEGTDAALTRFLRVNDELIAMTRRIGREDASNPILVDIYEAVQHADAVLDRELAKYQSVNPPSPDATDSRSIN